MSEGNAARGDRGVREVFAVAAGVAAYVALLWLVRGELGMTWDEPPNIERCDAIRDWLGRAFVHPAAAFGPVALERGWRFTGPAPHEHPPVYALLSLLTSEAFGWLVGPLRAHRLSTVFLFAMTAGVLFRLIRTRWGVPSALAALGGLLFNPRLFADAQIVSIDTVVGSFWFLSAAAFLRGCETGRRPWLFGVLFGLTVMSKATGVLAFPILALWSLLFRPRGAARQLAWALPIAPLVMIAIHPGWWTGPVSGVIRWASALLHYTQKVPVYYLGRVYDMRTSFLPWHNALVLSATMIPVGLLLLAAVGLCAMLRQAEEPPPAEFLPDRVVVGWAALPLLILTVLRMFPFMPVHDGLRQFAPALFFLPVLVGQGARMLSRSKGGARSWLARGAVAACVASASGETIAIQPYELEYYNILIGGPVGAKAAGMETTYYWDAATAEVLDWMSKNLPARTTVLIYPPPDVRTFAWLQRHDLLRRDLRFLNLDPPATSERLALLNGDDPCVLLFQMRQGLYEPMRRGAPAPFSRLADSPALYELAPRRVGVRLLAIFNRDQVAQAFHY